jgi:ribonucleotide reductase alpha subunit
MTGIDAMDIDHAIAQCVVAGGVRRSARMSMMHWKDPQIQEFVRVKGATGSHWTTNISVEVDDKFWWDAHDPATKAGRVLKWITEGMVTNGEPGFWDSSLSNVGEPNEVVCTNPCLTGDTVIATVNGPRTFADLAEAGEDVEVYSWDATTKTPVVRWMRRPHLTRNNAEILKVTFDSGLVVRCTPDHSFYTFRGNKVQAKDLMSLRSKSIRAFSASFDASGHERVHGWDAKRNAANHQWTHRMIWENADGPIPDGMVIAHLDGDSSNNELSNLAMMTPYEHASYDYPKRLDNGFHNRKRELHPANHKVISVEPAGYEDVYNGMVEDSHTYIVLDPKPIAGHMSGIVSANCGEITLQPWEPCNLGHVNLAAFVKDNGKPDYLGLMKAHRLMTRFLIRATFSDVADPKSREVLDRNRRIGVGHLGVASFLAMTGQRYSCAPANPWFRNLLREMAGNVDDAATDFSHQLRIPVPVKRRTVAPTGTIAKMPGVSEGIHPIFSKYFIRRIRFNDLSDIDELNKLLVKGYEAEDDLYAPNTTVVSFPTKDSLLEAVEGIWGPNRASYVVEAAGDLTLKELLAFQAMYQMLWADNAVSFTANVPQGGEATAVAEQLVRFGGLLKGATLFPESSIPQAPYERITKEEYEAATAKTVGDGVDEACANGACPIR